jgi:hypothetical protein
LTAVIAGSLVSMSTDSSRAPSERAYIIGVRSSLSSATPDIELENAGSLSHSNVVLKAECQHLADKLVGLETIRSARRLDQDHICLISNQFGITWTLATQPIFETVS